MTSICNYQYKTFLNRPDAAVFYVEKWEDKNHTRFITLKECNEENIKTWAEYQKIWDDCIGVFFNFQYRTLVFHETFRHVAINITIRHPLGDFFPLAGCTFVTGQMYLDCKATVFEDSVMPKKLAVPTLTKYPSSAEGPESAALPPFKTVSPQSAYSSMASTQGNSEASPSQAASPESRYHSIAEKLAPHISESPSQAVVHKSSDAAASQEVHSELQMKTTKAWNTSNKLNHDKCCVIL